jgi:hypothetical protein
MAIQNLVSASIAPDTKADILSKLTDIRGKLNFMMSLKPSDIQSMVKVGNNYAPFLDKAYATLEAYPDIVTKTFNQEEFRKDYQLGKDLTIIVDQMKQLTESLENTLTAANSDTMIAALEVYTAVKQHADRVPGLNLVSEEMAVFFKRTHHKTATTKA